jgi:hypothetical protein
MGANPFTPSPRHSRLFHCSALLWAVLLLLSGVRPASAAIECPHHAGSEHASGDATLHGDDLHAGHGSDHAHGAGEAPESDDGSHQCLCIGPCQMAGVSPMPAFSSATLAAPVADVAVGIDHFQAGVLPGRASYCLPYATAPPRGR